MLLTIPVEQLLQNLLDSLLYRITASIADSPTLELDKIFLSQTDMLEKVKYLFF